MRRAIEPSEEEARQRAYLAARYPRKYCAIKGAFRLTTRQVAHALGVPVKGGQMAIDQVLAVSRAIEGARVSLPDGFYLVDGPEADGTWWARRVGR